MAEMLRKIWNNPKHRKIVIVCLLSLVLAAIVIYQYVNREIPPPEGAIRVVICENCGETYATRIKDIDDQRDERNKCRKCQNKLSLAWKCRECRFQYPEGKVASDGKFENTLQKFRAVVNASRCPNCDSLSGSPMSVDELR